MWERRISGYPNQPPSIGDLDGDGLLDIVIGSTAGHIWALRGINGEVLEHFPVKLRGRVHSRPLLISLNPESPTQLHVVITADDGHIYMIDGSSGCYEKLDIGESSYSMVLAEDISDNGFLDLIVSTRAGNVYILGTKMPYHPLKSWNSELQGRNGFTVRDRFQGIFASSNSRSFRDISGDHIPIELEIVDLRPRYDPLKAPIYHVKVSYGNIELFRKNYSSPGVYIESLPVPSARRSATFLVEMHNEHQQAFFDSFSVCFNLSFHRILKWILVIPFLLMVVLLAFTKELVSPLPQ